MNKHRGLTETTLDVYQRILVGLLEHLGDDARAYSPEALRSFVLNRARPHGIYRAKSIVVAVRSFLRFLGATGRCPPGMEHAIPGFASWQLSSVPRFLVAEDVERVIGSCTDYVFGLRDRAVLLLLARLGLRAGEVAQLKFSDIDWRNGSIAVCGKGRRQELLPLPQEVGNAILRLSESGPAIVAGARSVHFGFGSASCVDACGCHPNRAERTASGGDQSAHQRCARPAALRRDYHAPPRCISGRRRCGPATPLSHDDGSLRQSGLRPLVGDRSAMAGGVLMLIAHVERYLSLRQTLGYKLRETIGQPPRVRQVRCRQGRYTRPRFHCGGLGDGGFFPARSARSAAKRRAPGPVPARRGSDPRGALQSVSRVHASAPALHLHNGGDCATRRSGQPASRVVPTSAPSLRDNARADCRDRAPHFGGARPPPR